MHPRATAGSREEHSCRPTWVLQLSPDSSIPVTIDRAVLADTGCSLSVGFLATIPPGQRAAFSSASEDYFVVRRLPVASAEPPQSPEQVSEEPDWHPTPAFERQMVRLLTDRMRRDLPQVDADLLDNQDHIAQREETWPLGRPAGRNLAGGMEAIGPATARRPRPTELRHQGIPPDPGWCAAVIRPREMADCRYGGVSHERMVSRGSDAGAVELGFRLVQPASARQA
jgi:hypothetical protein